MFYFFAGEAVFSGLYRGAIYFRKNNSKFALHNTLGFRLIYIS